ncbi:immunity 50 family protein [Burkholderia contaminans]|uniref:Imm50 family immunity protein n=1 Tax=Burkholderia contaminans TaxID=488447 RepID=UPI001CF1EA5A|nr:Imm50 family immunity protein [Burkholderia contaminans]MCA7917363.1 immunity 50 family protein [Burkholderia contaminans]UUX42524.1 immunity 50 family protein [Burkholderia contaminans]
MPLQSNYPNTLHYVRQSARRLTYDIGYYLSPHSDGSITVGYEIVQAARHGRIGCAATTLDFRGSLEEAERYLVKQLEAMVEDLPESWESDQYRNRKETDERAVEHAWLIRSVYGYWPKFHDAGVLAIALRRVNVNGGWQTDMELTIRHAGQDNPAWKGPQTPCRITFLFEDVEGTEFATENVALPSWIYDLRFSHCDDGRVQIDLYPSTGFGILLYCRAATVIRIEPCASDTVGI